MLSRRLLLAASTLMLAPARAAPLLEWVAGDLPPFGWSTPEGPRGFAQELVAAMAQRLGRRAEVRYMPWARAVRMVAQGDHFGVFPLARTPDREARFQWLVPLMAVRYGLYTLATPANEGRLGLAQRRRQRIGVLRGSPIVANLRAEGFESIVDAKDYHDLLRQLRAGLIDAVYAGAPMLEAAMDEYGHPRTLFTLQATVGEATLYMATSLGLHPAEAQRWVDAYRQLEEDGTVARLRQRYLH